MSRSCKLWGNVFQTDRESQLDKHTQPVYRGTTRNSMKNKLVDHHHSKTAAQTATEDSLSFVINAVSSHESKHAGMQLNTGSSGRLKPTAHARNQQTTQCHFVLVGWHSGLNLSKEKCCAGSKSYDYSYMQNSCVTLNAYWCQLTWKAMPVLQAHHTVLSSRPWTAV